MSFYGTVDFRVPANRVHDIVHYFGLDKRKNTKTDTLIAGCQSWAKFLDTSVLRGANIIISARFDDQEDSGLDIIPSNWDKLLKALDHNFWDRFPHMKTFPGAVPEAMIINDASRVAEVVVMAAMPYFRIGNIYPDRDLYSLEIPGENVLGSDDADILQPTNEIFEPLFGRFDEVPAYITAINYTGLVVA